MTAISVPPENISSEEIIARCIYSPHHVNLHSLKIKAAAFKPPNGLDEVSVNRLDFAGENFCHLLGLKNQKLEALPPKKYAGLGLLICQSILDCGAFIRSSPIEKENPFHADIFFGEVLKLEKGETLPAVFREKLERLAAASEFKICIEV